MRPRRNPMWNDFDIPWLLIAAAAAAGVIAGFLTVEWAFIPK